MQCQFQVGSGRYQLVRTPPEDVSRDSMRRDGGLSWSVFRHRMQEDQGCDETESVSEEQVAGMSAMGRKQGCQR